MRVLLDAALNEIKPCVREFRERGWPAEVTVQAAEPHEDHFFDVQITIRVGHSMPIPVEAR
jgi:hypothetical protein